MNRWHVERWRWNVERLTQVKELGGNGVEPLAKRGPPKNEQNKLIEGPFKWNRKHIGFDYIKRLRQQETNNSLAQTFS